MGDTSGHTAAVQAVAALKHDNTMLQKSLSEANQQNQMLRKQLFHVSTLLDVAVSKLSSLGVALETPVDVRAMRAELAKREVSAYSPVSGQESGAASISKAGDGGASPLGHRFQVRRDVRDHTKAVHCAAFGPIDQASIASGGLEGKVMVHNFYSGERLGAIEAHDQNVSEVAWFEGSGNLLSASYDRTVKQWDPRGSLAQPTYVHSASGFVLAMVPVEKSFVFACADSQRFTSLVDTRSRKPFSWEHEHRVSSLAFSSSSVCLITGDSNGTIAVWDLRNLSSALAVAAGGGANNAGGSSVGGTRTAPSSEDDVAAMERTTGGESIATPSSSGGSSKGGNVLGAATSLGALGTTLPAKSPLLREDGIVTRIENEMSHSPISYMTHATTQDEAKRLVVVSGDNIARVYRGRSTNTGDPYTVRNMIAGVPSRGFTVKAAFWQGRRGKNPSTFFDDGERESEPRQRRLAECDLVATGGTENAANIYDVTDAGEAALVQRLEGHRDRVVGATMMNAENRPIVATYSADSTLKIWFPVKV